MSDDRPNGSNDTADSPDEIKQRWLNRLKKRRQELEAADGKERAELIETVEKLEDHMVEEGFITEDDRREYSLQQDRGESSTDEPSDSLPSDGKDASDSPTENGETSDINVDIDSPSSDVDTSGGTIRRIYTGLLPTVLTDSSYLTGPPQTGSSDIQITDDDSTGIQESDGDDIEDDAEEAEEGISTADDSTSGRESENQDGENDAEEAPENVLIDDEPAPSTESENDDIGDDTAESTDSVLTDDEPAQSTESESDDAGDDTTESSNDVEIDDESTRSNGSDSTDRDGESPGESAPDVEEATDGESPESVAGDDPETTVADLESTIFELKGELAELEQQFKEQKQRNERKHEEIRKYSVDSFAQNMLQVRDTLQRAIELGDWDDANESRLNAVVKQFDQQFTKNTIEPIDPGRGAEFDPRCHEAIKEEGSTEFDAERVLRVETRGFELADQVIRPAEVVISARE